MSKRVSTSQLNHDNWDQEVEKEDPGTFSAASEQQLKTRLIKKAKRTFSTSTSSSSDLTGSTSSSPFQAFTGFSSKSSMPPSFSFLPQSAKTNVTTPVGQSSQNGCSEKPKEIKCAPAAESSAETVSEKQAAIGANQTTPDQEQDIQYFKMLRNLNGSVLEWMKMHFEKNPCCNFCPVFNDYKNYVQELEVKYLNKGKPVASSQRSSGFIGSAPSFKMPEKTEWMRTVQSKSDFFKIASPDGSSKRAQEQNNEPEMKYGAGFPSNTTNTSTVSFGSVKYPTETSKSQAMPKTTEKSEVDKDNDPVTAKESQPFTLSFSSPFEGKSLFASSDKKLFTSQITSPAVKMSTAESVDKDDDYVPPRNEVVQVKEDDAIYSKRCKLFCQKNGEYVDRGVGVLYLKPMNGKTQLLIRADTNLGNILLNIMLSASLPMQRTGKNNVLIVCIPNPPMEKESGEGDAKKPVPLLIRVKTSEDADELFEMLKKHQS